MGRKKKKIEEVRACVRARDSLVSTAIPPFARELLTSFLRTCPLYVYVLQDKPWCFYCDREFDDEKILIQHQKAKVPTLPSSKVPPLFPHLSRPYRPKIRALDRTKNIHFAPNMRFFPTRVGAPWRAN